MSREVSEETRWQGKETRNKGLIIGHVIVIRDRNFLIGKREILATKSQVAVSVLQFTFGALSKKSDKNIFLRLYT